MCLPSTAFVGILKLDRGNFESKITAYGWFVPTKEEKEKTQSLQGLAWISRVADSYGFSLLVRCRD